MSTQSVLDRFGITRAALARELGVDPSAITHRLRNGSPDWKLSEAQIIVAFINREYDPEFTIEDLTGSVGEDEPPQNHAKRGAA